MPKECPSYFAWVSLCLGDQGAFLEAGTLELTVMSAEGDFLSLSYSALCLVTFSCCSGTLPLLRDSPAGGLPCAACHTISPFVIMSHQRGVPQGLKMILLHLCWA